MNRLVQAARTIAQRSGRQHADRSGELGGLVGEDIPEHVGGHDHIELSGRAHELHGRIVHEHVGERHVRIVRRHRMHRLPPEARGLQHVRLVHACDPAVALLRHGKSGTGDALDLKAAVPLRIERLLSLRAVAAAALTKVNPAGELAHDHDVEPGCARFPPERAGARQRGIEPRRAQIGIHAERRPDAQQRLLRPQMAGQPVPLRPADRAEQHRIAFQTPGHRFLRQRLAARVDRRAADPVGGKSEMQAVTRACLLEHANRALDDLRPDAVSLEQGNSIFHGPSFTQSPRVQSRR